MVYLCVCVCVCVCVCGAGLIGKLFPTLCDPMDCSPPDSGVHGIFQAGVLEWVAISFFRCVCVFIFFSIMVYHRIMFIELVVYSFCI